MMPLELNNFKETAKNETVFTFESILFTNIMARSLKDAKYSEIIPALQLVIEKHKFKIILLQNAIVCEGEELMKAYDKLVNLINNN